MKSNGICSRPEVTGQKLAYSVNEVCELTGLGRDSIYKAIKQGKLVASKYNTRTLCTRDNVQRFLEALPTMGGAA